jgi:serine/threonine protein kinase, bacterial
MSSTMGRYTVLKRLSIGGMAEVFLAAVDGPGGFRKLVTIKRLLPDLQEDEELVRMFIEEARISAALSHANIAQVFELGRHAGDFFLAMEFVAGEDLARLARTTAKLGIAIPIGLTCMVMRDAANALHYAHTFIDPTGTSAPIIHRDVTPKNIMVTYSGAVKVIDFGIAKMKYEGHARHVTTIKGSSGYMSPEQVEGIDLDTRSDIFSLAVVMHELLTGTRLFKPDQRGFAAPDAARLVPPRALNPAIPEALSETVMRALAFDRSARIATGKELARAIEAAAPELFDAERTANVMQVLFANRIDATRTLLACSTDARADLDADLAQFEPSDPTDVHTARVGEAPAQAQGPRPRVLAVDDSPSSLQLLKVQLESEGFEVTGAETPALAFAALASARPDAIILDVIMPDIDGFELCRQMRQRADLTTTPILFLSAACSLEERIHGLEVGGDDFIRKPYTASEVALRVRSHLARVAMLRERTTP